MSTTFTTCQLTTTKFCGAFQNVRNLKDNVYYYTCQVGCEFYYVEIFLLVLVRCDNSVVTIEKVVDGTWKKFYVMDEGRR